ncbi:aminoacyl-tRNA hydrolase [Sulfurospirillum sp. 1612]|uniref:aminoacyl-tRNA hydrolase n=1 Tax=Sulfurospirillum sp. 1612 TaxID=3094835 RepID=UPI002F938ABB
MNLIVGLGNPEVKYHNNRHNIGFMVIDKLLEGLSYTTLNKPAFRGNLYKYHNLLLLKPQTYMNLSGESVHAVSDYFNPEKIIVIHDDLDLRFGVLKFKYEGGNGGHNGLKSIDAHIGKSYYRVRVGIGKPKDKDKIISHVLSDFSTREKKYLDEIIDQAARACLHLIEMPLQTVAQRDSLNLKLTNELLI